MVFIKININPLPCSQNGLLLSPLTGAAYKLKVKKIYINGRNIILLHTVNHSLPLLFYCCNINIIG